MRAGKGSRFSARRGVSPQTATTHRRCGIESALVVLKTP